ncbi:hypothetical protein KKB64_00455 [Patescibacteria group bacterium]|nr:hypothetical protein [Patescibacteria group bacterium]MBU1472244.1 hypothetical protein [Patescibacteria group bacterium]MBU2460505.1 hypothetical protein [Patescibacteria group bacterium]
MKSIAVCSSAVHFKEVVEIGDRLRKLGFKVLLPQTADIMRKKGDYQVSHYKTWWSNPGDYSKKADLIRGHFRKITQADAILVVNLEKKGMKGYIGGNTLMEMGLAFFLKKPIFIYRPISEELVHKEEIYGLLPIFINGDLEKIKKYFH